jgi:hypothetical protein
MLFFDVAEVEKWRAVQPISFGKGNFLANSLAIKLGRFWFVFRRRKPLSTRNFIFSWIASAL